MANLIAILALLPCLASTAREPKKSLVALGEGRLETIPMLTYKKDCWRKRPVASSLLQNPGAGLDAFTPFETVEKDGFFMADCVKDYMFTHGDKFGDNRHEYSIGATSNVSIVHYRAHVAKEDQHSMTQKVCFEFCRTVPGMNFFGITNGRECYCTPYFEPMASDSSDCDAVCEGEPTTMCGGKAKSSVFEMHMCASTGADLSSAAGKAGDLATELGEKVKMGKALAESMQTAGDAGQKVFGKDGNPGAANLMQVAMESAGKLLHSAEAAGEAQSALEKGKSSAAEIKDFADPAAVTMAERLMEVIEKDVAAGEAAGESLDDLVALAGPEGDAGNASEQYYSVMYFVDKEFKDVPTTCTGEAVAEPMVGTSVDECAAHCDAQGAGACVGFGHFDSGDTESLCFLFANFKTAVYYTGCAKAPSFLQVQAAPKVQCVAKLSRFEATTLKPDASGECKQCLKEATKADRCYE